MVEAAVVSEQVEVVPAALVVFMTDCAVVDRYLPLHCLFYQVKGNDDDRRNHYHYRLPEEWVDPL